MEYKVEIKDNLYNSIIFKNDKETLELSLHDIINFKDIKFFHDDIVTYDKNINKIINIKESFFKYKKMIGILKISKKTIFGFNKQKNPYYICTPLNKNYPNFLIAINNKNVIDAKKDIYVLFKYNKWIDKIPYGKLINIIGEVGNEEVEYNKILNFYKINQKKMILNKKYKINQKTAIYDIIKEEDIKHYENFTNDFTIAIDPKGCIDIDDALSYAYKNNQHIVGIHIADVSFWIDKLDLYKYLTKKHFTVYSPNKKFNIFPNVLADNFFSLRKNKDRLALSLIIYFDNDYNIKSFDIKNTIINVNVTTSYEKANNLIKSKHKELLELFKISKIIKSDVILNKQYDTHKMIENYMLYANSKVAEFLVTNKNRGTILRIHDESKHKINEDINKLKNKETLEFLKYYQTNNAIYKIYDNNNCDYYHYGLNLKYYTHFTSPIRRVIDIIIHLQVKEILNKNVSKELLHIKIDCNKINEENKRNKIMEREFEKIHILNHDLEDKIYKCYIIDFNMKQLYLYIPELKYLHIEQLIDKNIMDLFNIQQLDSTLIIKNINTQEKKIYEKYEELQIKIYKNINNFSIKILDYQNNYNL